MRRKTLIAMATKAGMTVTAMGLHTVVKGNGHAVTLWDDGTATRADVRLDLATRMTIKDAAKLLGLTT